MDSAPLASFDTRRSHTRTREALLAPTFLVSPRHIRLASVSFPFSLTDSIMLFSLSKGLGSLAGSCRPLHTLQQLSRSYSQSALSPVSGSASATPYSVPRNSRGTLPVYTDIRNGGTRYLVLVRNIRGDIHVSPFYKPTPCLSDLDHFFET